MRTIIFAALAAAAFVSSKAWAGPPTNNEVLPLIEMDGVLLTTAIRQLASQAHLNIVLDPRLSEPRFERLTVSIRWKDVTAREALVALLDNYGLVLVESPRGPASR